MLGLAAILAFGLMSFTHPGAPARLARDVEFWLNRHEEGGTAPRRADAWTEASRTSPPRPDPARFITAAIQRGSLEQIITATGAVQPVDTVEVGSQLPGQIARLFVDFNDKVRLGAPLAQLDQRSFFAKVDEARSSLDMAVANVRIQQAKLDRARIDLESAKATKAVLVAKLDNAQVMKASAERTVDRKVKLRSHEVATLASVEEAQTDLAARNAQVRESTSVLDLNTFAVDGAAAELRRLEAELTQAKAAVPLREAVLRGAEIDLDRTTIRSPTEGVVVGRFVNVGQTLAAGLEVRTAFTIARNLEEMEIHARVDETDIGRVAPGQVASFGVDAYPGQRFAAIVRQVRKAPQASQNVVTYTVVLTTDNRSGSLLPGMTALIRLTVRRDENVLKVPLAALRFKPEGEVGRMSAGSAVWVRDGEGQLAAVPVVTGASSSDLVSLHAGSGLAEGDEVVVGQADPPREHRLFGVRLGF
jgi:HlyD family secretion protein